MTTPIAPRRPDRMRWLAGRLARGWRQAPPGRRAACASVLLYGGALLHAGCAWAQPAVGRPQAAPAPPAAVFFSPPDISDASLSPDGRQVALVALDPKNRRRSLFVAPTDAAQPPRLVAALDGKDVENAHWVNNDWLVFDVEDLQDRRDAHSAAGLFSVAATGGVMRQWVALHAGTVTSTLPLDTERALHPDHHLLRVTRDGRPRVILGRLRRQGASGYAELLPSALDVASGELVSLAGGTPRGVLNWHFNHLGEARFAEARDASGRRPYWRKPGSSHWDAGPLADPVARTWAAHSLDGDQGLLVTERSGPGGTRVLKRFDFENWAPQPEPLFATPGFDFKGEVVAEAEGGPALGVTVVTDRLRTHWFDPRMAAAQAAVDRLLPGRVNRLQCARCGQPDMVALVRSWSDREPVSNHIYRAADGVLHGLGSTRPLIQAQQMGTMSSHRVVARDGRDLPVDVWLPAGFAAPGAPADATPKSAQAPGPVRGRPAVLWLPTSLNAQSRQWLWSALPQFLATRGYVVVAPRPRGTLGFGEDHHRAGWKAGALARLDDGADALAWAVAQGWVDPLRVCAAGGSFGGTFAVLTAIRNPGAFRCAATWSAPMDLRPLLSWRSGGAVGEEARLRYLPQVLGDPARDAQLLFDLAPVEHASRLKVPLLLAYGDDDRLPDNWSSGERMRRLLDAAGHPAQLEVYRNEGHDWLLTATWVSFAQRLEGFLAQHLAPAPATPTPTPGPAAARGRD